MTGSNLRMALFRLREAIEARSEGAELGGNSAFVPELPTAARPAATTAELSTRPIDQCGLYILWCGALSVIVMRFSGSVQQRMDSIDVSRL